jgi:nicotinamidase/pyrazinamidase
MPLKINDTDVLLVVDIQNDFCPGGSLAVPAGDEIVPLVNRLAAKFQHVVLTQDWHPAGHSSFASMHPGRKPFEAVTFPYGPQVLWPDHCVQGSIGAEFHAGLDIPHAELIIRKGYRRAIDSYSAFFENDRTTPTGLAGYLRERELSRVFIVGLALDFCVRFSAEDGHRCGFDMVVIEEASRGIDLDGSIDAARRAFVELYIPAMPADDIR